jgi:hypothetical protein
MTYTIIDLFYSNLYSGNFAYGIEVDSFVIKDDNSWFHLNNAVELLE